MFFGHLFNFFLKWAGSQTKETINKMKRLTEWENIFTNGTSDTGLISQIYKELNLSQHHKNKQFS